MRSRTLFLPAVAACFLGCASSPGAAPDTTPKPPQSSGSLVEPYFPLVDGNIYSFATTDAALGDGLLTVKAHRTDALHGDLTIGATRKSFVYSRDAVSYESGAVVLKAPLEKGKSWEGEHGCPCTIAETGLKVELLEKSATNCIETSETCRSGTTYRTTYCPNIGIAKLVVEQGKVKAVVQLRSYGPPITL